MKHRKLINITSAALCLALAMLLPLLTGQLQPMGNALCPMHIPVLLCGFVCGWQWGLAVGFISPLLRFALFGMPPLLPTGAAMAFELAAYGAIAGLLFKYLPRTIPNIFLSLVSAMVGGRIIWGGVMYLISGFQGTAFPLSAFIAGAVTNAIPGIVLQIILIPALVIALMKTGIIPDGISSHGKVE